MAAKDNNRCRYCKYFLSSYRRGSKGPELCTYPGRGPSYNVYNVITSNYSLIAPEDSKDCKRYKFSIVSYIMDVYISRILKKESN